MHVFFLISIPEIKLKYKQRELELLIQLPERNDSYSEPSGNGGQISFASFASENEHLFFFLTEGPNGKTKGV